MVLGVIHWFIIILIVMSFIIIFGPACASYLHSCCKRPNTDTTSIGPSNELPVVTIGHAPPSTDQVENCDEEFEFITDGVSLEAIVEEQLDTDSESERPPRLGM